MTLSPAQKAAATRRARKAAMIAPARAPGLADAGQLGDLALLATFIGQQADVLIREFGTLAATVAAPLERIAELTGTTTARTVKALAMAAISVTRGELAGKCCLSSFAAVTDYLRASMRTEGTEQFRVLFLNKRNELVADEVMGVGTIDHVPVYPREVAKRALELGASAIFLSHNHPSGDPTPSSADVEMTKELVKVMGVFGIAIYDHIIVGRNDIASLKGLRMM